MRRLILTVPAVAAAAALGAFAYGALQASGGTGRVGAVSYHCTIHPQMHGVVVVQA